MKNPWGGLLVFISSLALTLGLPPTAGTAGELSEKSVKSPGGVFLEHEASNSWLQEAKLTAGDGGFNEQFGASVGISGDTVVIGARYADGYTGAAYVFEKPTGGWHDMTQTAKLTPSDGTENDFFGCSVAVDGDTIVIGAYGDDDNGSQSGSAYVFEKPIGGWMDMTQTAKLTPGDGAASDVFGCSVAVGGDTIVIGARGDDVVYYNQGSAYVFEKPTGGWMDMTQTAKLTAGDGVMNDDFGQAVAVDGDTVVVGAYGDDIDGLYPGRAYVFEKPMGGWINMTHTAQLTASNAWFDDEFGYAVAVRGNVAAVGAYKVEIVVNEVLYYDAGCVYIFERPESGWTDMTETAWLIARDVAGNDNLGYTLSFSGDRVIAGAWGKDDCTGAAYVFDRPIGGWVDMVETTKLTAGDGASYDDFGYAVSVCENTAIIGAHMDDDNGNASGSAYVFSVEECSNEPVINSITFKNCISSLCASVVTVDATDPCGGSLNYEWQALDGGGIAGEGAQVEFQPPGPCLLPDCDPYRVHVSVTSDASGLSAEDTIGITVKLAGDADGSGRVDILDKRLVRDAYGSSPVDPNWDPRADTDCSDRVDILDKRNVRDQYGDEGCACP